MTDYSKFTAQTFAETRELGYKGMRIVLGKVVSDTPRNGIKTLTLPDIQCSLASGAIVKARDFLDLFIDHRIGDHVYPTMLYMVEDNVIGPVYYAENDVSWKTLNKVYDLYHDIKRDTEGGVS